MSLDRPTLPKPLQRGLRQCVGQLRAGERRLRFSPRLHVGLPGGPEVALPLPPDPWWPVPAPDSRAYDARLRLDVVSALLARIGDRVDQPVVWLTRPGELTWHDLDADWLWPAVQACAEAGLPDRFVVVTKRGWYDPRTGTGRQWARLRL